MMENFLISSSHLQEGRIWTLVTSVFSHNMLFHMMINMFVLRGFGEVMEEIMGSARFLILYLMAGIAGSLGHCFASTILLQSPDLPALGASGAVSGILVTFSLIFPKHIVYIFGLIPIPALVATILFIGIDSWGLIAQTQGSNIPIGFGAHLAGALIGFIFWMIILRRSLDPTQMSLTLEVRDKANN